jgi:hypothetical protein
MNIVTTSRCPSCNRAFTPGDTWKGANYCRGLFLLGVIEKNPGLSAWELSEFTSMSMTDAQRGLAKLRDFKVVGYESEPRDEEGSFRYRFYPLSDHAVKYERFKTYTGTAEDTGNPLPWITAKELFEEHRQGKP